MFMKPFGFLFLLGLELKMWSLYFSRVGNRIAQSDQEIDYVIRLPTLFFPIIF